jgi:hypothetical protein
MKYQVKRWSGQVIKTISMLRRSQMKKLAVLLFVVGMIVAFAMPAAALENVFGGYWRTRAYTNQNFDGNDDDVSTARELTQIDTRTRLYWTAILNDNLKFVNKFEFNGTWGDQGALNANGSHNFQASWTDFGADGTQSLRIKNSYVAFNIGPVSASVGVQPATLARGFLFDDDAAGVIVTYDGGAFKLPLIWLKAYEGGTSNNSLDVDCFAISPTFKAGQVSINPFAMYSYSDNASGWVFTPNFEEISLFHVGLDLGFKMDKFALWMVGIYEGGTLDFIANNNSVDVKAWLAAAGGKFDFGAGDVHARGFYATGQDPDDNDITAFFVPPGQLYRGQYYNWSEILGEGILDAQIPVGSCGTRISNVMAANLGVTVKPMKDLSVTADVWFAQLAEDRNMGTAAVPQMEKDLGIEANLIATYQLVKNLNLDLVAAYLFAGDAIYVGNGDADPYELGARLSLSF